MNDQEKSITPLTGVKPLVSLKYMMELSRISELICLHQKNKKRKVKRRKDTASFIC